ncbi:MAG: FAD-binding oxidoreductase [Thermoplasmata archaeon]|nr:FAD-binding oxidoreductase [Thermoplasmata archaeon]
MKDRYHVVIIGGGVSGCGLAYTLSTMGITDVLVLEKRYLNAGATGRCGGGIRQQWSTRENIRLAMESVKRFEVLAEELEYEIEYEQGGYLILNYTEEEDEQSRKNVALQNSMGLDSRYISPEEAREIVPALNTSDILGATFCPTDGHANPFWVTEGYARAARRAGVEILTGIEATGFRTGDGRIEEVETTRGPVKADYVVNAAGAWSATLAARAGVELPNRPYRHEILATEVYRHFLDPMVISFSKGIYFSQTKRGEIVGGIGDPNEPSGFNMKGSLNFLHRMAREITHIIPSFRNLNVVRQWAGLYDVTPDARPILGAVPELDNFIQMNGYSGHGFMISPMCARLTAEIIAYGRTKTMSIDTLTVDRFRRGDLEMEANVVG